MRGLWLLPALAALLGTCGRPGTTLPDGLAADSGRVNVGSATLHYVVEGSGTPCLVIGSEVYYRRTFSSPFKSQLRCVYLDHRGFTEGAQPEAGEFYGVPAIVADLEKARQQLGLDRFVLVGHSVHGLVALAYAARYPQHMTHVVAIGAPREISQARLDRRERFWQTTATPGRMAQHEHNLARLPADSLAKLPSGEALVARVLADAARDWIDSTYDASWLWSGVTVNGPLAAQIFDVSRPFTLDGPAGSVAVPAYVALGRFDFSTVPYTDWETFRGPFANLTVKIFDRAAHMPQLEDSTAFDEAVLAWLKG